MIVDIALLIFLAVVIIQSYHRGALSALSGVITFALASFVTVRYVEVVSKFLYDKFLRGIFVENIKKNIFNGSVYHEGGKWRDFFLEASKFQSKASDVAEYIVDHYLQDVILQVTGMVLTLLLFWALSFVLRRLLRLVTRTLHHTPVLGSIDQTVGGIMGVLEGILCVAVLAYALSFLKDSGWDGVPASLMQQMQDSYFITFASHDLAPFIKSLL